MFRSGLNTIFGAIDAALDKRKLGLAFLGIVTAVFGGGLFWYLGALLGDNLILTALFGFVGMLIVYVVATTFSGSLAWMGWQELAEDNRVTIKEALAFGRNNIVKLVLSPFALVLFGLAVIVAQLLLLLLGRIPYLGDLLVAVAFLPLILINTLLFIFMAVGAWMIFPVIAEEQRSVSKTIGRIVALVRSSPARLISYYLLALVIIGIALAIVWSLLAFSLAQTTTLIQTGIGGDNWNAIVRSSMWGRLLSPTSMFDLDTILFGLGFGASAPFTAKLAAFIMGLSTLLLIVGATMAFPWAFSQMVSCAIYFNLRDSIAENADELPFNLSRFSGGGAEKTPPVALKTCPNCDSEITADTRFCMFCGAAQPD
jgi:hypothetical protein